MILFLCIIRFFMSQSLNYICGLPGISVIQIPQYLAYSESVNYHRHYLYLLHFTNVSWKSQKGTRAYQVTFCFSASEHLHAIKPEAAVLVSITKQIYALHTFSERGS